MISPSALSLAEQDKQRAQQAAAAATAEQASPPATVLPPKVHAVKARAERKTPKVIASWELKQLKNGPDPLGRGLATMVAKGARCALFLSITAPPPGSPVPHFTASAALLGVERRSLWTGMMWDPLVVPELWNLLVRGGYAELSPPGTQTNIKSNRNVVRASFGVETNEWLLLVRAGPAQHCRGILALISDKSLLTDIASALPLISAPIPAKKAA